MFFSCNIFIQMFYNAMSSYFHPIVRESGSCSCSYNKIDMVFCLPMLQTTHISTLQTEWKCSIHVEVSSCKVSGLPRPGCKCIAFYWSLQRSAAQWLPLDGDWTLWWRYTTSFIHNIIDMIPLFLNFFLWFIHADCI